MARIAPLFIKKVTTPPGTYTGSQKKTRTLFNTTIMKSGALISYLLAV